VGLVGGENTDRELIGRRHDLVQLAEASHADQGTAGGNDRLANALTVIPRIRSPSPEVTTATPEGNDEAARLNVLGSMAAGLVIS
jgi:hypothetical protein